MRLIEEKILKYGKVYPGNVLKVDSFLNHQVDVPLIAALAQEIYQHYNSCAVTKILTIEASGILLAGMTAQLFHVPMLFAKKSAAKNMSDGVYTAKVRSFTHGNEYTMVVSKEYLNKDDKVLLIDDFLADGNALRGLMEIVKAAGAVTVGAGIAIEKGFQQGGDKLREEGLDIFSLAIIGSMDAQEGVTFRSAM